MRKFFRIEAMISTGINNIQLYVYKCIVRRHLHGRLCSNILAIINIMKLYRIIYGISTSSAYIYIYIYIYIIYVDKHMAPHL